jgi:hypothetical protein
VSDDEGELADRLGQVWRTVTHELVCHGVWLIVERREVLVGYPHGVHWRAVELTGVWQTPEMWLGEARLTLAEELGPGWSGWERVQ